MKHAVTLYELGNARDILDTWIEEHEGELIPDIETLLEDLDCAVDDKVERVAKYILEMEATAAACREEARRLTARAHGAGMRADSLRDYLQTQLARLGKKKIETRHITVTRQRNAVPSIALAPGFTTEDVYKLESCFDGEKVDAAAVPVVERRVAETYHIDRKEVERRVKAGESLPAGIVIAHGEHVRIR